MWSGDTILCVFTLFISQELLHAFLEYENQTKQPLGKYKGFFFKCRADHNLRGPKLQHIPSQISTQQI
jgi:hypothetical protein